MNDYEKTVRALDRVKKLLALADRHPDTEEGRSARRKALQLSEAHGLDMARVDLKIAQPKRVNRINPGMFDSFAATVKKQYPGIDDEDYSQPKRRGTYGKEED